MIVAVKTTTMMRTTTSPISTIFGDQQRSNGSWFTLNATLHGLLVACVKHFQWHCFGNMYLELQTWQGYTT